MITEAVLPKTVALSAAAVAPAEPRHESAHTEKTVISPGIVISAIKTCAESGFAVQNGQEFFVNSDPPVIALWEVLRTGNDIPAETLFMAGPDELGSLKNLVCGDIKLRIINPESPTGYSDAVMGEDTARKLPRFKMILREDIFKLNRGTDNIEDRRRAFNAAFLFTGIPVTEHYFTMLKRREEALPPQIPTKIAV